MTACIEFSDTMQAIQRDIGINRSDIADYQDRIDELKGEILYKQDEIGELEGELQDLEEKAISNPVLGLMYETTFGHLVANKAEHRDYAISRLPSELIRYGLDQSGCIVIMKKGAVYSGIEPYPSPDDEMILIGYNEELGTVAAALQDVIEGVLEPE